jgi:hypothetical protein
MIPDDNCDNISELKDILVEMMKLSKIHVNSYLNNLEKLQMSKRTKKLQLEPSPNFICNPCSYICDKKFTFCKHLQTAKHLKNVNLQPTEEIIVNNINIT